MPVRGDNARFLKRRDNVVGVMRNHADWAAKQKSTATPLKTVQPTQKTQRAMAQKMTTARRAVGVPNPKKQAAPPGRLQRDDDEDDKMSVQTISTSSEYGDDPHGSDHYALREDMSFTPSPCTPISDGATAGSHEDGQEPWRAESMAGSCEDKPREECQRVLESSFEKNNASRV